MPSTILSDNGVSSGSAGLKTTAASDGALVLQTSTSGGTATNAVYVDNNQNVGLGSAPSAWGTGGGNHAIEFVNSNSSSSSISAASNYFTFVNNAYYDGSNYIYKNGSTYPTLVSLAPTGSFSVLGAPTGTAGTSATFTSIAAVAKDKTFVLQGGTSSSGTGIAFPATQSASSDANTLDDYEEGTWTPSLGGSATYTARSGTYTKIGALVSVSFDIQVSSIGTGSTRVISGLPFTPLASSGGGIGYFDLAASTLAVILCRVDGATTNLVVDANTTTGPNLTGVAVFGNGTRLIGTVTYRS